MANPVSTELEVLVLDWLGKMLGLPHEFLASSDGPGGGVIQVSFVLAFIYLQNKKQII